MAALHLLPQPPSMPTLDTALAFFSVALLLGFTPGPDNLFVLVQAATRGRRAGLCVVLGLCTGLVVHTVAVALGLAAVFAASATAFTVLKLVGAAYLLYLAWQAFHAPASSDVVDAGTEPSMFSMYLRGVVMNLTNPKVVFFFLAFLPQFVRPEQGPVATQILWLGLLFILSTLLSFGIITVFASANSQRLRGSAKAQQALNRTAALVFCGLALRLALAER